MSTEAAPSRVDLLELDVDVRMTELWGEAMEIPAADWELELVGAFMRACYGLGYADALKEDAEGRRAELMKDHGYKPL